MRQHDILYSKVYSINSNNIINGIVLFIFLNFIINDFTINITSIINKMGHEGTKRFTFIFNIICFIGSV